MNPLDRTTLAFIAVGAHEFYQDLSRLHISAIDVVQNVTEHAELLNRSFEEHLSTFEGVFAFDVAIEFGRRAAQSYIQNQDDFDEEVERHIKDLLQERGYPPLVVYPRHESEESLETVRYQRNLLGQAILGTAVELGLVRSDASADGPQLMVLCKDIVDYTKSLEANNSKVTSEPPFETKFTIYWRDGRRSVVIGDTISEAFTKAGYGGGAANAIDWYDRGESNTHDFIKGQGWVPKPPSEQF